MVVWNLVTATVNEDNDSPTTGLDPLPPMDTDHELHAPLPVATQRSSRLVDQPLLPITVKSTRGPQTSAPLPTWRALWEESNQRYISDKEVTQTARGSNDLSSSMTQLLLDQTQPEESYITVPYEPDPRFQKKVWQRSSVVDPRPVDLSTMVWEL